MRGGSQVSSRDGIYLEWPELYKSRTYHYSRDSRDLLEVIAFSIAQISGVMIFWISTVQRALPRLDGGDWNAELYNSVN